MNVVEGDNQTDRAGRLRNSQGGVALIGRGVGLEETRETLADERAALTEVVADTHTLDAEAVELSDDAGHIPAGATVVLLVAHVELTPGGSVLAKVRGGDLARSGSPTTLRVVVNGNVLGLSLLNGERKSIVRAPEAVHLATGTIGVPEENGPGLDLAALEAEDVLVLAGIGLGDLDDVATPGVTDVTHVVPVEETVGLGLGDAAESRAGEGAVGGSFEPIAAGAGSGHGLDRGLNGAAGGSVGRRRRRRGGSGSRGDNDRLGRRRRRRRRSRSRGNLTSPLVDPGLENAVDGGSDDVTDSALAQVEVESGGIGGQRGSRFDLEIKNLGLRMSVTALVAVQTSRGRASGQGRSQKEGILEVHDDFEKERKG